MSADELRKAAEKLREQAKAATGDWHPADHWYADHEIRAALRAVGTATDLEADAAYIATMHPGVGLALADWLEFVWRMGEPGRKSGLTGEAYDTAQALAVARLILGGGS